MAWCLVDYLNRGLASPSYQKLNRFITDHLSDPLGDSDQPTSERADPSLRADAAIIAGIKEPERTPTFVREGNKQKLILLPAFQPPVDPEDPTREIGINREPAFQPPPLDPEDPNHAAMEKNLIAFAEGARRLSHWNPEAVSDKTWAAAILIIFIYCRDRIPKLKLCPRKGCPRFFLGVHGKDTCSIQCTRALVFQRYIEKLKQSPGAYEDYLRNKRAQKRRLRKKRQGLRSPHP